MRGGAEGEGLKIEWVSRELQNLSILKRRISSNFQTNFLQLTKIELSHSSLPPPSAPQLVKSTPDLSSFLRSTLLYVQHDHNQLNQSCSHALSRLVTMGYIIMETDDTSNDSTFKITSLGKATYKGLIIQGWVYGHSLTFKFPPPIQAACLWSRPTWYTAS